MSLRSILKTDVSNGKLKRIFGNKRTPRTEYNAEVLGKRFMYGEIGIDHLEFLGEAQEFRIGELLCQLNHHIEVFFVRNIARRVPAKELAMESGDENVALE